jgi:DNA-binding MarR family transcriptional regulator
MTQQRDPFSPNEDSTMRILEPPLDAAVTDLIAKLESELGEIPVAAVEAHNTLVRANAVYAAALGSRYESLDISVPRFNLLRHLYHAEEHRLTMSELGAYMNVSVPNVMRMVQALDGEGWLRCEKSVQDRRVTFVELTQEGHDRFAALLPRVLDIWQELWS